MGTKRNTAPERDGDEARKAADKFLAPVIEGTKEYGSRTRLGQLLAKRLKAPVDRHLLKRMLNEDDAKRKQPHLGVGLIVREVFDKNRQQLSKPTQLAYWNRRPKKKKTAKPKTKKQGAART